MKTLTYEEVRELFNYDPDTGLLTWRVYRSSNARVGQVAGHSTPSENGRWKVNVYGVQHFAHRVIWLWMTGALPKGEIDHIDGDASNNRWSNLRDVDQKTNLQNVRRPRAHNKSTGVLGVSLCKATGRYRAQIVIHGCTKNLGRYDSVQEAHEAYLAAKRKLHAGCTL